MARDPSQQKAPSVPACDCDTVRWQKLFAGRRQKVPLLRFSRWKHGAGITMCPTTHCMWVCVKAKLLSRYLVSMEAQAGAAWLQTSAEVRQYGFADFFASLEVGLLGSFHALWKQQVQAAGLNGVHVVALIRVHGRRRDAVGASSQVEKRQRAKESEPNTLAASCPWYPGPRSSEWYLNTR